MTLRLSGYCLSPNETALVGYRSEIAPRSERSQRHRLYYTDLRQASASSFLIPVPEFLSLLSTADISFCENALILSFKGPHKNYLRLHALVILFDCSPSLESRAKLVRIFMTKVVVFTQLNERPLVVGLFFLTNSLPPRNWCVCISKKRFSLIPLVQNYGLSKAILNRCESLRLEKCALIN